MSPVFLLGNPYENVQDIFDSSCTNCHSTNNPTGGLSLSNYYDTMLSGSVIPADSDGSELFDRIENGNMPPGSNNLSSNEIQVIKDWIDGGSYNGISVDYQYQVQPIFDDKCISCHSSNNPSSGLSLSTYTDVIYGSINGPVVEPCSSESSELYERIESGNMPPGSNDLTLSQVSVIMEWINEGALDYPAEGSECSSDCIIGDVNYDGILNVLDVVSLVSLILSGTGVPDEYCEDPNQDGILNVLDIVTLVGTILND